MAQAKAAANSRFVPSSENWAAVEASNILPDMIVAIAGRRHRRQRPHRADAAIEEMLNRLSRADDPIAALDSS